MITPEEAIAEEPEETIAQLEPGIDQTLNDQFIEWGDVVPVSLVGHSEKVFALLIDKYQTAGWTVTQEKGVLLFTAEQPK